MSNKILDNEIGQGNWKICNIYQKACFFLRVTNFRRDATACGDTYLVHATMREESCHWAFCMLLKIKLVCMEYLDSDTNYNCEDCLERESRQPIKMTLYRPSM